MSTDRRVGLLGTTLVHLAVIGGALWAGRGIAEPMQLVYAVDLVAAAMPEQTTRDVVPETKTPPPVKATEEVAILKPTKKPPEQKPPVKVDTPPEKTPVTSTAATKPPLPGETPWDGQNVMNLSIPGFQTKYSWYTDRVVDQLMDRFGRQTRIGNPEVEVRFRILADGSVTNITMTRRSSSFSANQDALTAVETAGRTKAFGPLPDNLTELDISFTFTARP